MKKLIIYFACLTMFGCAALFDMASYDITQPVNDFSFVRVEKKDHAPDIGKLISADSKQFVEFGADSTVTALFVRSNKTYLVEFTAFYSGKGALGAFTLINLRGAYPLDIGSMGLKNDTVVQFVKGRYIVTVSPRTGGTISGAQELAVGLSHHIRGNALEPELYSLLPERDLLAESEFFFMGPAAFSVKYPTTLANLLEIENITGGVSGTYSTEDGDVDFLRLTYGSTNEAKSAVNNYIRRKSDRPIIQPRQELQFYTIIEADKAETYIADYADRIYFMPNAPRGKKGRQLFEYILRGAY